MKNIIFFFSLLFLFSGNLLGQKKTLLRCVKCEPLDVRDLKRPLQAVEIFNGLQLLRPDGTTEEVYAPYSVAYLGNTVYLQSLTIEASFTTVSLGETIYSSFEELLNVVTACKNGSTMTVTSTEDGGVVITNPPNPPVECEDCEVNNEVITEITYDSETNLYTVTEGDNIITFSAQLNCDSVLNCVKDDLEFTSDTTINLTDNTVTVESCITIGGTDICTEFTLATWDCEDTQDCISQNLTLTKDTTIVNGDYVIETCVAIGSNTPICADVTLPCVEVQEPFPFTVSKGVTAYNLSLPDGWDVCWISRNGKIYTETKNEFTFNNPTVTWSVDNLDDPDCMVVMAKGCKQL